MSPPVVDEETEADAPRVPKRIPATKLTTTTFGRNAIGDALVLGNKIDPDWLEKAVGSSVYYAASPPAGAMTYAASVLTGRVG